MNAGGIGVRIENVGEARLAYEALMGQAITEAFRRLLANKHLYQSEMLNDRAVRQQLPLMTDTLKDFCEKSGVFSRDVSECPWRLNEDVGATSPEDSKSGRQEVAFSLPHVKLNCSVCQAREVFNPVSGGATIRSWEYSMPTVKGFAAHTQVYQLVYLCQQCRSFPEVFLVRRAGAKLTLCGRAPMEHAEIAPETPKQIAKYYSGAVIAFQSGQSLAGIFLLRTACEQWCRLWATPDDRADSAIEKYMATLPEGFKAAFPSIRSIYERLSADLHAANGSDEVFLELKKEVDLHFKARAIFPEISAPPGA